MALARSESDFEKFMPFSRGIADLQQNVIIVDIEPFLTRHIGKTLQADGIDVVLCAEEGSALDAISSQWNGVLVAPLNMPGMGGLEFLEKVKGIDPHIPVLMITGYGDDPQIVNALRLDAYDVIEKSFPNRDIKINILRALEKRRLVLENRKLKSEIVVEEKSESSTLSDDLDSLNSDNQENAVCPNEPTNGHKPTLVEQMNAFEKNLIAQELARTSGDVKATYLTLGLPRKTFYEKMKKYALKRKDFLKPVEI